jgi:hypothetical protein
VESEGLERYYGQAKDCGLCNKVLHDAARTMVKRTTVVCANRVLHDAARALVKRRTVVCANRVLHDCGLCQTYGLA